MNDSETFKINGKNYLKKIIIPYTEKDAEISIEEIIDLHYDYSILQDILFGREIIDLDQIKNIEDAKKYLQNKSEGDFSIGAIPPATAYGPLEIEDKILAYVFQLRDNGRIEEIDLFVRSLEKYSEIQEELFKFLKLDYIEYLTEVKENYLVEFIFNLQHYE